jgi:hypothetical protein
MQAATHTPMRLHRTAILRIHACRGFATGTGLYDTVVIGGGIDESLGLWIFLMC